MNEKPYTALEVCLKALETGADPESVLKLFPDMENDLLPLLETSRQARMLAISEVPDSVLRRSKARVLQHAASLHEASARQRRKWALFAIPRLAVSLAITVLFLLSGTGLVRASNGALPGDNLYPVKRTWEGVRLLLVLNPESREELENEFEKERLHEIDELLAEGRHETIAFAGVVTEQIGDHWIVSGVPVQITPETRLPATPVTMGTSIMLQGRTNVQGFVEADFIEVLGSNYVLPTSVPTEIDMDEDNSNRGNSGREENDNDQRDEVESDSSSEEGHDNSNSENDNEDKDDSSNSDSGSNDDEREPDPDNDNDRNGNQSEEDTSDHSGSGGGGNENEGEGHD